MYLSPYRRNNGLFSFMDDLENSFFNDSVSGTSAFRTDIKEKDGKYLMEAELPGFKPEDINIDLNDNTLTISATNEVNNDEKDEDGKTIRRERRYGSFSRSFDVSGIDTDGIHADYESGILKLTLPKREKEQPKSRRIELGAQNNEQREIPLETQGGQEQPEQESPAQNASKGDAPVQ